ncbi:MAG: hypothetical protein R6U19_07305, partial [Bacteroidales bacterium]
MDSNPSRGSCIPMLFTEGSVRSVFIFQNNLTSPLSLYTNFWVTLMVKLNKIITSRFLKHLAELAEKEPATYEKIWKTFGIFLKEGATSDFMHREALARLLRFESSKSEPGQEIALSDYVTR